KDGSLCRLLQQGGAIGITDATVSTTFSWGKIMNGKLPFRLTPLAAAVLAGSLLPFPVVAQEGTIQEITVTAQFREESLQETPIAITAISGDMLEARNQIKLSDITAQAPNVLLQVNPAGGGNAMRAYIRGVGQADQSPSVDPGVGIYIDDVYFSTIT